MKKEKIIKEKKFLNKIYHRYKNLENEPQTQAMRELAFNLIKPHLNKNNIALELGCSDGFFTSFISTNVNTIDVVDATKKNLDTRYYHFLDVGCGNGIALIYAHKRLVFKTYSGFDFIPNYVNVSKKNISNSIKKRGWELIII
jgi:ribosomal protein L11 methylase PrmA